MVNICGSGGEQFSAYITMQFNVDFKDHTLSKVFIAIVTDVRLALLVLPFGVKLK